MSEKTTSTTFVRLFVASLMVMIIALAAFGLGLAAGSSTERVSAAQLTAGSLPALPAAATAVPSPTVTPEPDLVLDAALFDEAMNLLEEQFFGDLPQGEELTYDAIRGVVDRLGDEHTAFVDPEAAKLMQADLEGHFEGIGARVQQTPGGVQIEYLFPDQPAERSGLRVGDVIIKVDGEDVTGLGLMEAISKIRGPRGSEVLLTIQREGEDPLDVKVTRAQIEIPVVESETLADGKIAHITLSEFSTVAPQRLSTAVTKALRAKPDGMILDLRGNPGGLLDAAVSIGSMFVPEGSIVIERTKDGDERVYERKGRYLLGDTPLVVLVDGGSASASEIVAGAIQDAGTGVLIGEKTYGKGSVQLPNTLSDGSQLRVTIAHWFTPKNRGIDKLGLDPDIEVKLTQEDREANKDPQLDQAVEYLLEGK